MTDPLATAVVARRVHYAGRVQGVGFRATTVLMASNFPVGGWVRNLPDGRVELHVEGLEAEVMRFLRAIRDFWGDSISEEQIAVGEPSGQHTRFQVVH